jgi:hypothetical protein
MWWHAQHALPPRETSGVDSIFVEMMEKRSFDHFVYDNASIPEAHRVTAEPAAPHRAMPSDVRNLAFRLNLASPDVSVPALPTPAAPPVAPCPAGFPIPTDLALDDILDLVS